MQVSTAHALTGTIPTHVAVIMDGNGRWARMRGLPRTAGHSKGADAVRRTVRAAGELGVSYLTLFSFSSENWTRPETEIEILMGLLRRYLRSEIAELHQNNVRVRMIGNRSRLPRDIVSTVASAEERTRDNTGLNLVIALSYGSRQELTSAMRALAAQVATEGLDPALIDEAAIEKHLATAGIPDPDLLIRTSGEQRISNFLLWQLAYTELVFLDVLWPDFDRSHFEEAIREFNGRDRRFGGSAG